MRSAPAISRRAFLKGASALAGFALAGCGPFASSSTIRILFTNDSHGQLLPVYHREVYADSFLKENGIERGSVEAYLSAETDFPELAEKYGKVGGYAQLATLIDRERAAMPERTILLEAGDAWYGSAIALLTDGKAPVDVMNAIGYDAMTMHWEFNLGKEMLLARIKEAKFPVIAQNLVDTDFEDRVLAPSVVKQLGDVKVGIVGEAYPFSLLTTELRDANLGWRMGYREDELQKEIERLRQAEGAQIIVLLSHMGLEQDRVLAQRWSGVDVIIGSHTHDILWKPLQVGKTIITQAGSHGKFLGELDLEIRGGKVENFRHQLIPVLAERVEAHARIRDLIAKWYQPHQAQLAQVIGETQSVLYRRSLYGGTSDAFLAQAYRALANTEVACLPGWRFGTSLLPGAIRVEDVYNAMKPTRSPLYTAKLSGRQIRRSIEDNLDNVFNANPLERLGGDVLRCGGVQGAFKRNAPAGQRIAQLSVGDKPIDEEQVYKIATSGGRTQYMDQNASSAPRPAVEDVIAYIQKNPTINASPLHPFTEAG